MDYLTLKYYTENNISISEAARLSKVPRTTMRNWYEKFKRSEGSIEKFNNRVARKNYTKQEIEEAVKGANSYSDVFRKLNIKINGGSFNWIKKLINKFEIETHFSTGLNVNFINAGREVIFKKQEELYDKTENISTGERLSTRKLRSFLIYKGHKEECSLCGLTEWYGERLRLDIHHIDGNCCNNHLNNLQFICPNCHRKETIKFKESNVWFKPKPEIKRKRIKNSHQCLDCGVIIAAYKAVRCIPCHRMTRCKINWPDNNKLKTLVETYSLLSLGKVLGVSDIAIKKRCRIRNILIPTRKKQTCISIDN